MTVTPPTTLPLELPQSTPIKINSATTLPFTTNQKYRIESCSTMASEMRKYLVGPMPPQQFLNDFFPLNELSCLSKKSDLPSFSPGCYHRTVIAESEKKAYNPFIESTQNFLSGLTIVNSSDSVDRNPRLDFPFKIKPDITVYCTDSSPGAVTDSYKAEMFIEFKWNADDDPFGEVHDVVCQCINCAGENTVKSFHHDTKLGNDTLGQITAYAAAVLGSQFRTHIYSVLIVKDTARIIRWDRSGAIVTEAIKYNEMSFLAEFFRRYSKAPPDMRGKDQSVSCPTPTEAVAARQALNIDDTDPLVKFSIPGIDNSLLYYVASAPRATLYTPPGRATRGFPAYDLLFCKPVFLKDSWRVDLPDIWEEGMIYATLAKANVRNIPKCIASGNISTDKYHATKTCYYTTESWACHSDAHFIPHRHYRLALDIIGRCLTTFKSSYEMVSAVRDAIIAHKDAYEAGILHRDLSPGNIIIVPGCKGLLIDWDLSKPLSMVPETPRRATRTGTWQFMSARLIGIMDGVQQHNFQDDLESSIYVLLWMTLMYSSCSDIFHVPHFLSHVLDPQPRGRDGLGSLGKADFLQARTFLKLVNFPGRPSLHKLIFQLAQLFSVRYEANDANLANGITVMPIQFSHAYEALIMMDYKFREEALSTHDYTINLFDQALLSCSTWPSDDSAVKQDFQSDLASPRSQVLKTGWDTMCVVYESNKEVIDLADVDTRSSDSEQSDRMTEGSDFFDDNSF